MSFPWSHRDTVVELSFTLTPVPLASALFQGLGAAGLEAAGTEPQVWGPS